MKTTKAVIYVRAFKGDQAASVEAQEATCREFAAARGWEVVAVHIDANVSGMTWAEERSGLVGALASLKRGSVLLAASRDRLAQNAGVGALLEEKAERKGASVVTPDAPEGNEPSAVAMRQFMDIFTGLEHAKRVTRPETSGEAADVEAVTLIHALRADGMPLRAIAAELDARGATGPFEGFMRQIKDASPEVEGQGGRMKRGIVAGRLVESPVVVEDWEGNGWAWAAAAILEPSGEAGEAVRCLMVSDASARMARVMTGRPACPYALGDLLSMVVFDGTGFVFGRWVTGDEDVGTHKRS